MGELKAGQSVGSWNSNFGEATLTVKNEIGSGYATQEAAAKAAFNTQSVITHEQDNQFHAYAIDDGANFDDLDLGESVSLKKGIPNVNVLDVIGDDHYQLKAERKAYPPIGKDNGKVVYFMRRYEGGIQNFMMDKVLDTESRWSEEIKWARKKGYTVVLDPNVSYNEMKAAFYDPRAAGIVFSGHGGNGGISVQKDGETDDRWFGPSSLDKDKVSKNLKLVSFQSCETGQQAQAWQDVTHGAQIDGWKRVMNVAESAAANDPGLLGAALGLVSPALGLAVQLNPHRLDRLMENTL